MENLLHYTDNFFINYGFAKLVSEYDHLFDIFKNNFWYELKNKFWLDKHDRIVGIQRGLIDGDKQIFWDYLWVTHNMAWIIPNLLWWIKYESACTCVKFILWSGNSIIITTDPLSDKIPEWVICLDSYYLRLSEYWRKEFDKIFLWINKIESEYFRSNYFQIKLEWIKKMSKNEILKALNVVETHST